jgi:HK97 family phage portal protein/HK97 family phage prohead protease
MSFITAILEEKRSSASTNLSNPTAWFMKLLGGGAESKAGIQVSADTALQVSAVFACIQYISRTIAALPCHLYKRTDRGKDKAVNHPLYWLLYHLPNKETTAFDFWRMLLVNLLLCPEAYAWIERDGNGTITALWNVPSNRVKKYRNAGTKELYYAIADDEGIEHIVYPENMFVLRNMRFGSKDAPLDPVVLAREALGLALAQEEYNSRYFSNGANSGGVVQTKGRVSPEAFQRFKETFMDKYAGVSNAARVLFLEEDWTYTKVGNTPEESQLTDSRVRQIAEVARFFGNVPLHKILDLSRSTNNNIEHQGIEAVVDCLTPYLVQIEQEAAKDLLLPTERKRLFVKFSVSGLLRGDMAARKDFYKTMIDIGAYSPNKVLELEDENTYEGGDIHVMNAASVPVEKILALAEARIKKGGETGNAGNQNTAGTGGTEGTGYAVKWDQLSENLGWGYKFRERFRKGAFTESLRNDTQKAFWNHNSDIVLGSTKSGSLRLAEDDVGLRFEIDIPATTGGDDAYKIIKRGDVDGVSFGFEMQTEEWDESDEANILRTIIKAKLYEVSPTPFPAYPQTEIQARSAEEPYKAYKAAQAKTGPSPEEIQIRQDFSRLRKKLLEV